MMQTRSMTRSPVPPVSPSKKTVKIPNEYIIADNIRQLKYDINTLLLCDLVIPYAHIRKLKTLFADVAKYTSYIQTSIRKNYFGFMKQQCGLRIANTMLVGFKYLYSTPPFHLFLKIFDFWMEFVEKYQLYDDGKFIKRIAHTLHTLHTPRETQSPISLADIYRGRYSAKSREALTELLNLPDWRMYRLKMTF